MQNLHIFVIAECTEVGPNTSLSTQTNLKVTNSTGYVYPYGKWIKDGAIVTYVNKNDMYHRSVLVKFDNGKTHWMYYTELSSCGNDYFY